MNNYFVTGIGTGVGKTVISAILTEKLKADYWKPIQSGDLGDSDTLTVRKLVSNNESRFHPESYRLTQPLSPHESAHFDGVRIKIENIKAPHTANNLIIEGAGGLLVPLNEKDLMIDLISHLQAEVILVSRHYLGSINHTLLSIEALQRRSLPIKGIVFVGEDNPATESVILGFSNLWMLGRIPEVAKVDKAFLSHCTSLIRL